MRPDRLFWQQLGVLYACWARVSLRHAGRGRALLACRAGLRDIPAGPLPSCSLQSCWGHPNPAQQGACSRMLTLSRPLSAFSPCADFGKSALSGCLWRGGASPLSGRCYMIHTRRDTDRGSKGCLAMQPPLPYACISSTGWDLSPHEQVSQPATARMGLLSAQLWYIVADGSRLWNDT